MDLAEEAIAAGKCDMVAMIRQFIADPDCVNKVRDGKGDEVRPCIRCCVCVSKDPHGNPMPIRCTVNPPSGRSPLFDEIPMSENPKKVVVVGGGAAGMEAARRLSDRGNSVVLFEKAPELGGTLIEAYANRLKFDVKRYSDWSVYMTEKYKNIDIRKGTAATRELVLKENPDAVIVAVGGEQIIPNIPGVNGKNVCLAVDVDMGKVKVGKKVVIIGAGLTGSETAVTLAQDGHDVTQIDMLSLELIDSRMLGSRSVLGTLRGMVISSGVKTKTGLKAVEITEQGVTVVDEKGVSFILPCDTVVLSVGVKPRAEIAREFENIVRDVYFVGDCTKVGNITTAVRDAFYAAMRI
jgi:NADPH-dependent 2,4-dienoyl-CoA reductase/sulfur reductase-like enzyme